MRKTAIDQVSGRHVFVVEPKTSYIRFPDGHTRALERTAGAPASVHGHDQRRWRQLQTIKWLRKSLSTDEKSNVK